MKKLIIFSAIFLVALAILYLWSSPGTTYYIGSDPSDDYASWTAMQAVVSETAGDTVSFRQGETFREQITVPNSGTSGNFIRYTVHGSGVGPIINGAALVTGWTEYSNLYTYSSPDNASASTERWYRTIIPSANQPASGTKIRIQIETLAGYSLSLKGCSIGERSGSTEDYSDTPSRITFNSGNSGVSIGGGATKYSDWITYSFDTTKQHLVHFQTNGAQYAPYINYLSGSHYKSTATDETLVQDVTKDGDRSGFHCLKILETSYSNTWQATLTTEPTKVWLDGVLGTKETAIANLDTANEWFWASNVLYVYSTSDPDTAYITPGIEAAQRNFCITTNSKDYIIIGPGIQFKYANSANVLLNGANQSELNYCISIDGVDGVEMDTAASKVQNCVIYNCTNGIDVDAAGYVKNTIIRNCTDDLEETGASINKTTNSIEDDGAGDPLMVDPANGDFLLQKTSPCRDAGTDVGLTRDYRNTLVPKGSAPDIGAHEYFQAVIIVAGIGENPWLFGILAGFAIIAYRKRR